MINKVIKWVFETVLRKKMGLKKGSPTADIKWYESETIWAGAVMTLYGAYELARNVAGPAFGFDLPQVPENAKMWASTILGGTVVWGRWTSERNIE